MKAVFTFLMLIAYLPEAHCQLLPNPLTPNFYQYYHKINVVQSSKSLDQRISSNSNIYAGSPHSGTNQQWLIMPLTIIAKNNATSIEGSQFMIASRANGKIMQNNTNGNVYCASVVTGGSNQTIKLTNMGNGIYEIASAQYISKVFDQTGSSQNRDPYSYPNQSNDNIYLGSRHGGTNQQFRITPSNIIKQSILPNLTSLRSQRVGQIPFPRQPTGFGDLMPEETGKTFVSETLLPFPLIKNDLALSYQVENSPYYKLTRYQYYKRSGSDNNDITYYPGSEGTRIVSVKTGMKRTDVDRVKRMLSIQFTAGGEVGGTLAEGITAKVTASVSSSLSLEQENITTIEESEETTVTFSYVFKPTQSVRVLTYVLMDYYELRRSDGSLALLPWEVVTNQVKERTFPAEVALNGRSSSGSSLTDITKTKTIYVTVGSSSGSRTESLASKSSKIDGNTPIDIKEVTDVNNTLNIRVYPNPTKDIFTLVHNKRLTGSTSNLECSVSLYRMNGSLVHEYKYLNNTLNEKEIDISHLPTGLYLVRVIIGSEVKTERIHKE